MSEHRNDQTTSPLPPESLVPDASHSRLRMLARKVIAPIALVAAGAGVTSAIYEHEQHATIGEATAITRLEDLLRPEAFKNLDATSVYEKSTARLSSTPFKMQSELSDSEAARLAQLNYRVYSNHDNKYGKGGVDTSMLSSAEQDEFQRLSHLASDARGIPEKEMTTRNLILNNATFVSGVHTASGIDFNFYQANTNPDIDTLVVDPKAVDTMVTLLLDQMSALQQQFLPATEIARLQHLADDGGLNKATISVIVADDLGECIVADAGNYSLRAPVAPRTCYGGGAQFDLSSTQYSRTSDYRNPTIMLGRFPKQSSLETEDTAWLTGAFAHEMAHSLVGLSTITEAQRGADFTKKDPFQEEHQQFVGPLGNVVGNQLYSKSADGQDAQVKLPPLTYVVATYPLATPTSTSSSVLTR